MIWLKLLWFLSVGADKKKSVDYLNAAITALNDLRTYWRSKTPEWPREDCQEMLSDFLEKELVKAQARSDSPIGIGRLPAPVATRPQFEQHRGLISREPQSKLAGPPSQTPQGSLFETVRRDTGAQKWNQAQSSQDSLLETVQWDINTEQLNWQAQPSQDSLLKTVR